MKNAQGFVIRMILFAAIIISLIAFDACWFQPVPPVSNSVVNNQFNNTTVTLVQQSNRGKWVTWIELGVAAFATLTLFGQEIVGFVRGSK